MESQLNKKYALTGTILLYSWLGINIDNSIGNIAWFVPFLGFFRYLGIRERISVAADYLREFEGRYFNDLGWEGFLHEKRKSKKPREFKALDIGGLSAVAFWSVLLLFD